MENYVTEDNLYNFIDKVIGICKKNDGVDYSLIKKYIAESLDEMSDLSTELNMVAGNSISFQDFVRLVSDDEEARNLFNRNTEFGMQFDEIESDFKSLGNELEKYFKAHPDTEEYLHEKSMLHYLLEEHQP